MKIYPSKHLIKAYTCPPISSIPIGHIEKEIYPNRITIEKQAGFAQNTEAIVSPYDVFDSNDLLFFDANEKLTDIDLKRNGSEYTYEPNGVTEFSPDNFTVKALIKKNLTYDSSKTYNIKIAVNEPGSDLSWSKQLISIFGDAPVRGICPASVRINNMSMQPMSLINSSYADTDFIFVQTYDGIKSKADGGNSIDIEKILGTHTNMWITVDSNENIFDSAKEYASKNSVPVLYSGSFSIPASYGYKVKQSPVFPFDSSGYSISFPFSENPIVILEKQNGGYIVISHTNLFDDLKANAALIYEVLMTVYLKSYTVSSPTGSWITNEAVDYIGDIRRPFGKKHLDICLDDLIDNTNCVIDNYILLNIIVDGDNIVFLKRNNNNMLFFEKIAGTIDPQKGKDIISIYTTKNTVIQYKTEVVKTIESSIQIDTEISTDNVCSITLNPFKSSLRQIILKEKKKFIIEEQDSTYCLAALPIGSEDESHIIFLKRSEYIPGVSILLAKVTVGFDSTEECSDIRLLGGGLPESCDDNYEMLDIGNLYGRPYRVGTSMVIKVPSRLNTYDSRIQQSIDKNKNAADLVVVAYEK